MISVHLYGPGPSGTACEYIVTFLHFRSLLCSETLLAIFSHHCTLLLFSQFLSDSSSGLHCPFLFLSLFHGACPPEACSDQADASGFPPAEVSLRVTEFRVRGDPDSEMLGGSARRAGPLLRTFPSAAAGCSVTGALLSALSCPRPGVALASGCKLPWTMLSVHEVTGQDG